MKNQKYNKPESNASDMETFLSPKCHQLLLGSLLGDMYLRKEHKNPRIEETHSIAQKEYLNWKKEILKDFFDLKLHRVGGSLKSKARGKEFLRKPQFRLRSRVSESLRYYHDLLYKDRKKRVSEELLNQIDTLGLAVWFCDDGYYDPGNRQAQLHTEGFTIEENKKLRDWFRKKWNVDTRFKREPWKGNIHLRFSVEGTNRLLNLMKEHVFEMPKSIKYKLGHVWKGNNKRIEIAKLQKKRRMKTYGERDYVKAKKREEAVAYYYRNHEKSLMRAREYYQRNKEKIKAYMNRPEVRQRANGRAKEKWRTDAEYREKRMLYLKKYRKRLGRMEKLKEYKLRATVKRKLGDRN